MSPSFSDGSGPAVYKAYAKLNLGLRILGERDDGYHDIETVYQAIDLADEIAFTDAPPGVIELDCEGGDAPSGPENLVHQAARLLQETFRPRAGVAIRLRKRIPAGAGLGGGSSDAAATLAALSSRWGLGLGAPDLEALAARLGSDVPFFVRGGTQFGRGRGEVLLPLEPLEAVVFVVAVPGFRVSTKWAYEAARRRLTGAGAGLSMRGLASERGVVCLTEEGLANDLEPAVTAGHPGLVALRRSLMSRGFLGVGMSGSGSAFFGVTGSRATADAAVAELSESGLMAFVSGPKRCGWERVG
jgi:4-diphosphocytidyl-2-C-methyl-D-erythritol kinase